MLNCFSKVMEKMLLSRINIHLQESGGLSEAQYGFRKGWSTMQAIEKVMTIVDNAVRGTWRKG